MTDTPGRRLARALQESTELAERTVAGLGPIEADRALFFVQSAYDLAIEMWFQKGDPGAPRLTNWELPWRKFGGDNPTTTYLSAPVSASFRYRLTRPRRATRCTRACRSTPADRATTPRRPTSPTYELVDAGGEIDLLIGGEDPGDGSHGCPLLPTTIW